MASPKMPPLPPVEPDHGDDDFLAFWNEHAPRKPRETKRILGVDVVVPTDLPLSLEGMTADLAESAVDVESAEAQAQFKEVLVVLFGEGTYELWKANGLTGRMLQVLFVWGLRNGSGQPTSFEEALELAERANEESGKEVTPINRAARRASSKTRASGSTGRSSSRTSGASTKSRQTS